LCFSFACLPGNRWKGLDKAAFCLSAIKSWGSLKSELRKILSRVYLGLAVAALMTIPAWPQQTPTDLANKSVEGLMNIEVTSVSKKEQKLSSVAAAIFVITQKDIRRSGATNIPDLLRIVPGLDVAQINASTWAISARGFNLQFANKLLVQIDGRAVYTPLFGGVNWDTQDMPLEDIERIEVIRGPAGTVWGANAVNGVINVISKRTADTQGGLVTSGGARRRKDLPRYSTAGNSRKTQAIESSQSTSTTTISSI
jgi:iron complex outermembrane recepter protein